ncbi:hypothetical protein B0T17DRAFT_544898 [Bombardia bombarda]|uniref:Cytochrome b5 heme-binding domain-containing protein n=1 Tax=Bombardia bombarda TaxID=252184 RepID=A0AA39WBS4_9PEZI|nr:hypothetical protein B0T17DRAFT_544898 [Bombardia bombarda]
MALIGISLIFASVVFFCLRLPAWVPAFFRNLQQSRLGPPPQPPRIEEPSQDDDGQDSSSSSSTSIELKGSRVVASRSPSPQRQPAKAELDRVAMPPPPPPPRIQVAKSSIETDSADDEQTTPKASAVLLDDDPVPSFALSSPDDVSAQSATAIATAQTKPKPSGLSAPAQAAPPPIFGLMAPPPRPSPPTLRAQQSGSSTLPPQISPIPNRNTNNLPIPNRGGPARGSSSSSLGSSLLPPPSHSSKPKKPSRAVILSPGHSPLDWARLSNSPAANLRGLPTNAPYLRPLRPFHPGGEPELMRAAARDGTTMFNEIHPWVNYEGMLSACLVGIYVQEEDVPAAATAASSAAASVTRSSAASVVGSGMEDMD